MRKSRKKKKISVGKDFLTGLKLVLVLFLANLVTAITILLFFFAGAISPIFLGLGVLVALPFNIFSIGYIARKFKWVK